MKTYSCLNCNKICDITSHKFNKYCSNLCQQSERKSTIFEKVLRGEIANRPTIRKSIIWKNGHKCSRCNLSEWQGEPIALELDHIDGNAGNNSYENVRVLCPNCHSLTDTWKGRNKGSGRASIGMQLN